MKKQLKSKEQIEENMKNLIDEHKLTIFAHFQNYHKRMSILEAELHEVL